MSPGVRAVHDGEAPAIEHFCSASEVRHVRGSCRCGGFATWWPPVWTATSPGRGGGRC